jgi:hypothetical protein
MTDFDKNSNKDYELFVNILPNYFEEHSIIESFSKNNINFNIFGKENNYIINQNNQNDINDFVSFSEKNQSNATNPFNIESESFLQKNKDNCLFLHSSYSKLNSNQLKSIDIKAFEIKKQKNKIFKIGKDNKNKGRIRKNTNFIGKHDKFSEDNIIRKFKGRFIEKCRIYINKEYKRFLLTKKNDIKNIKVLLQRISPKLSKKIKKEDNLKWLNSKLNKVFSEKVSVKCSLYESDYNKKEIQKLYKENEAKNVLNILNRPVKEMLNAFIQNKIPGFDSLNEDINELKEKMKKNNQDNIKEYLIKYKQTALNFESIFINKNSRNNK